MFTFVLRTSNKDIVKKGNKVMKYIYLIYLISLQIIIYFILDLPEKYLRGGINTVIEC